MTRLPVMCQTSFLTHRSFSRTSVSRENLFVTISRFGMWTILLTTLLTLPMLAQTGATGGMQGTVTDQSGAVLPDAAVSITDIATNTTSKTTTNNGGHFVFANVTPSTYNLKITKQGFETALVQGQSVAVGQTLTEDVKLTIGSVAQEITVETTGTELQTLNATVGNSVTGVALQSLPAIGGDVSTFMTLQPGVAPGGQVGGTVSDQSTFQLDGGNNTSDMDGNQTVYTPSFGGDPTGGIVGNGLRGGGSGGGVPTGVMPTPSDSVEEFKVNTSNQTADFNSSAGAQVQVVTKRGTNAWHGTAYEYYLDNNFDANTWQNNLTGTPIPDYHYSRFGGAFGGPIIPKNILGGKTYFFGMYQGFRWPNSQTQEFAVPSANMRNGILTLANGQTLNLNSTDPRAGTDVGNGINPLVQQFWNKFEPTPNDPSCGVLLNVASGRCDGINVQGFKANVALPQNDNFGVARIDHDFGAKWHFNSSFRYYHLQRATLDQVDIGGFFSGDKLGTPSSLSNRPEVPWYYVAGLTTNISTNITNDFHYSFLRNWWAWGTQNAPPQLAGLGGALEPMGEANSPNQGDVLAPYNVNAQQVRTRFWDGMDHYFRDDITMLHGNHLFTFGGAYQHNWNYHQRTDNGGGINFTPTYQLGDTNGVSGGMSLASLYPAGVAENSTTDRYMAAMLGIVTDSQVAYTRTGANLALNPPLTPAFDQSTIPYYNVYFSDSWHLKPSLTVTYGMGWTLEMPPTEATGKQVILVNSANEPIGVQDYIDSRERAALQGQVYNPQIGFSLIGNTANSPKYPYNPFYGAFSPRAAVAWNPNITEGWFGKMFGGDKTVIRTGYGRIYGRLNGVNLVLVPLLGTGLIQAVQCTQVYMPNAVPNTPNGSCAPAGAPALNASTAFRIGVDGLNAPLNAASPTLPQPVYPGFSSSGGIPITAAAAGTTLDPHTRPNAVDSVDFTIQRQLTNKITMEMGYIGRYIHNEFQPIDLNAVPYMMTLGGQSFSSAYASIETALGCASSVSNCAAAVPTAKLSSGAANPAYATYINSIAPQSFLTSALNSTYCTGNFPGTGGAAYTNCTAAFIDKNLQNSNLQQQRVWNIWTGLDNGGTKAGFNFGCSMLTCGAFGPNGAQLSTGFSLNSSLGYGNYNAGFVTLRMSDYHGVTLQQNLTYSKALGTGDVTQSTSSYTADDPFNLREMYGLQSWDRKYVYNLFLIYQPPYYRSQQGVVGHLLGGWNLSPIFTAGSGAPLFCTTKASSQAFGAADGSGFGDNETCGFTGSKPGSSSANYGVSGGIDPNGIKVGTTVAKTANGTPVGINYFSNPVAAFDQFVNPILGITQRDNGNGPIRGLPYWNMDLSVRKNFKLTERFNTEFQFLFLNVFNHMDFANPSLSTSGTSSASWGVLNTQGNTPRQMEFGLRLNF